MATIDNNNVTVDATNITIDSSSLPLITVSMKLVNFEKSSQPSITGITACVFGNIPTIAAPNPVAVFSNLSTDTNGYLTFSFTNAALSLNQSIWLAVLLDGSPGRGGVRKITPTYS